jgi:hypothetical protein
LNHQPRESLLERKIHANSRHTYVIGQQHTTAGFAGIAKKLDGSARATLNTHELTKKPENTMRGSKNIGITVSAMLLQSGRARDTGSKQQTVDTT